MALSQKARWLRNTVLDMAVKANSGHLTTAFSQAELLIALYYGKILNYDPKNPKWDGRDRFILSKGQGGIGMYPVLADVGYFSMDELQRFAQRDGILGVHADWNIPGIEVITGSLGHGLPIATGMAQAAKMDRKSHLVVCLLGDAECYEGSNWEAAAFAAHQGLNNIVCVVDKNGQGTIGFTDRIEKKCDGPNLDSLADRFRAFGFETREIDGHSFDAIFSALQDIRDRTDPRPLVIVARTVKGKGSAFLESRRLWHYRVPTGADLERVRKELQ